MTIWPILHWIIKTVAIFQGSISVSMSIHQTFFCFICTHLTSGEKEGDELKRNADVHDILRRTHFHSLSYIGLPKKILDHEWVQSLIYHDKLNCYFTLLLELLYIFPHCMFYFCIELLPSPWFLSSCFSLIICCYISMGLSLFYVFELC